MLLGTMQNAMKMVYRRLTEGSEPNNFAIFLTNLLGEQVPSWTITLEEFLVPIAVATT